MQSLKELVREDDNVAIFVVHGIGQQLQGETAAQLYSSLIDTKKRIEKWQASQPDKMSELPEHLPYTKEGYWADYNRPEVTVGPEWENYTEDEKNFSRSLWAKRVTSASATYWWFIKQTVRLWAHPFRLAKVTKWRVVVAWPLYFLLASCAIPLLTFVYVRKRSLMRDYLNDVRIYVEPRDTLEEKIVAGVETHIKQDVMMLMGLSTEFHVLAADELPTVLGTQRRFDRVIWVAHSLGTVISYKVLSDLLEKAVHLQENGDPDQKEGVKRFKKCLVRFVTLGSPLDKIAFLFQDKLRPWPVADRNAFFDNVDDITVRFMKPQKEWWINFYHVLDPVSGSLENRAICGNKPPANFHSGLASLPGLAHTAYWKDLTTLRLILSRAYGRDRLRDKPLVQWPSWLLTILAAASYVIWALIMVLALVIVAAWVWQFLHETWGKGESILQAVMTLLGS